MKKLWILFQAWRSYRHMKKVIKRSKKQWPQAYKPQGFEFDFWEE